MKRSIYDLNLDLQAGHSPVTVWVKRGDTRRTLRIRLTDGGRPYQLTADCTAVFTAQKPDGTAIYNHCTLAEDHILYDLTPQTTGSAGELPCQLRLYGPEEALLTSAAFLLWVEDTVYTDGDETVTSTGEATALTKLMTEAGEKLEEMEKILRPYTLIENITLEEAVARLDRRTDLQGNQYNFSAIRVLVYTPIATNGMLTLQVYNEGGFNNQLLYASSNGSISATEAKTTMFKVYNDHGLMDYYNLTGNTSSGSAGSLNRRATFMDKQWSNVTALRVRNENGNLPAGTRIVIYGIRG